MTNIFCAGNLIENELREAMLLQSPGIEGDVTLDLPLHLARQLCRMFGPVAFHINPGESVFYTAV